LGRLPQSRNSFSQLGTTPGVPHEDALEFYQAAAGPKELKWYDTAHDVDDIAAIADRARFLAKALGLRVSTGLFVRKRAGLRTNVTAGEDIVPAERLLRLQRCRQSEVLCSYPCSYVAGEGSEIRKQST